MRHPRPAAVLLCGCAVFLAQIAVAAAADEIGRTRRQLGRELAALRPREAPLEMSRPLMRLAQERAEKVRKALGDAPTDRPEFLAQFVPEMSGQELARSLEQAEYRAHRAVVHLALMPVEEGGREILQRSAALETDLQDLELLELGVGVADLGVVRIAVFVLARSEEQEFESRTSGLGDIGEVAAELFSQTNEARERVRSRLLRRSPCLERVAQRYAEQMLAEGFYGHRSPGGDDAFERVTRAHCGFRRVAENLALGPESPTEVIAGWLASPEHRRNLVGEYRAVGHGLAFGRSPLGYRILWVQLFGDG